MQDGVATIMAAIFYLSYLLALLLLPLLAQWRCGLVTAFLVTVAELALVALVFYLMAVYHLLPDVSVGEPAPDEHPFAKIRRGQAQGYVQLLILGATPAVAALIGGGLALVWSIAWAVWRSIANRKPSEGRS
jgi:hypothetical protein